MGMATRHRRRWRWVSGIVLSGVVGLSPAPSADVIDRVLAVVDRTIITQSDVLAAMRLDLGRLAGEPAPAAEADALERQIERRLMLIEVDRYSPPEPAPAEIDRRLASIRSRFTSDADLQHALEQVGLTTERVRRIVRDDLRLDTYLDQRFGAAVQPSDEDLVAYYRAHLDRFSSGGVPRPFNDVHDDVRAAVVLDRRPAQIASWVSGLRRRADIVILTSTPRLH
jgi:hypothetical protein